MAYFFVLKMEQLTKVACTEQERLQSRVKVFCDTLKELDELKKNNSTPITTSAELWQKVAEGLSEGKTALNYIINLENAYIKAKQYIEFADTTRIALKLLNNQIYLVNAIHNNKELTEKQLNLYHNFTITDCNELFRYYTVWDYQDNILKLENKYINDQDKIDEMQQGMIKYSIEEMGYGDYVNELIKLYNEAVEEAIKWQDTIINKYDEVYNELCNTNKSISYKYDKSYTSYDESRAPLGYESAERSQLEYQKLMNEAIKNYKKENLKKDQKEDVLSL